MTSNKLEFEACVVGLWEGGAKVHVMYLLNTSDQFLKRQASPATRRDLTSPSHTRALPQRIWR